MWMCREALAGDGSLDKHLPQKAFFDLLCESSAVALPLKCCYSVSVVLS